MPTLKEKEISSMVILFKAIKVKLKHNYFLKYCL